MVVSPVLQEAWIIVKKLFPAKSVSIVREIHYAEKPNVWPAIRVNKLTKLL